MTKKTKLKLCDWSLLFLTIMILASGLQLEINPAGQRIWVWVHIALGTIFIVEIMWHLGLHHNSGKSSKQPEYPPRKSRHPFLGICFLLTMVSGVVATGHWIGTYVHSTIGGIHGKIGFLFIIAIIRHIVKHIRFYKG